MKFPLLLSFFIVIKTTLFAQNLLVKKNGETVPYKKLKWEEHAAELTTDKKQKIRVQASEVNAIFEGNMQRVLYKKPRVSHNEKTISFSSHIDTAGFQFLAKEAAGKITLYKEEIVNSYRSGGMAYATSTIYYYAEKGKEFKNVLITGLGSKKDDLIAFKSFFTDDPEVTAEIEKEDFVYNEKNMLRTIRSYNLKHFQKPSTSDYKTVGLISFYTKADKKVRDAFVLKVNDSLEYKMPVSHFPLPLKLPAGRTSKVCVTWGDESECELVEPIAYATTYYQIRSLIDKTLRVEKASYVEFKNYMLRALESK